MSGIKSMADELREAMLNPEHQEEKTTRKERPPPAAPLKQPDIPRVKGRPLPDLQEFFTEIKAHEPGQEKLLIRLAPNTVRMLKQLKIMQAIDVNKFISFALHEYLKGNPALISYIKESLNQFDL